MMNRFSQFKLSFFVITTLLVLLGAVNDLPIWLVVALFEAAFVIGVGYLLCYAVPESLRELAVRNGFRFDGSRSTRREVRERRALMRFRITMIGLVAYGVLSWNWIYALARHYDWLRSDRWPWLAGAIVFWLAIGGSLMVYLYIRIVGEYRAGLESRRLEYEARDLGRVRSSDGTDVADTPEEMPAYRPSDLASGAANT
jgi:hypothetical protein